MPVQAHIQNLVLPTRDLVEIQNTVQNQRSRPDSATGLSLLNMVPELDQNLIPEL